MKAALLSPLVVMALSGCDTPPAASPIASSTATSVQPTSTPSAIASTTHPMATPGSFEDDLAFLEQHGSILVLESKTGGRIAVSPKYQGRVMTSAVAEGEKSLGFVFRPFIEGGKTGTQFDNYGGEDRFWLGPEGGQFGLYFAKGKAFQIGDWQTPSGFQEGEWAVKEKASDHVTLTRSMTVTNHAGVEFHLDVARTVRILDADGASARLGAPIGAGVKWVGFETVNTITNTGTVPWTKKDGLLSVWILSMFNPSPDTFVAVPFDPKGGGDVVNDKYFGKVPADRLAVNDKEGFLLFACDGHHRSKIGLGPTRAKPFLGSYSPSQRLLTLVNYDKPAGAKDYVNSMWETQKDPFGGDVVNSYNDGPTEPGKPSLGGFYEIETSSPAAALAPKASLVHTQRTFHLVGDAAQLDPIAKQTLGIDTARIGAGIPK